MELKEIADGVYALLGGSNAGLIVRDREGVVVDAGLDRDAAKMILRAAESLAVRVTGLLITHAHADHFGGAATIRARTGAKVYAPGLEAAVVANPLLEPIYLFAGAAPPADLRHKFTLAAPCQVDEVVEPGALRVGPLLVEVIEAPGHSPNQMIYCFEGACFMADACFAPSVLEKHLIPFYVDVDAAVTTLARLTGLGRDHSVFVAGHGPVADSIASWAERNLERIGAIRAAVMESLDCCSELDRVVEWTAEALHLTVPSPVIYYLTRTTVLACLKSVAVASTIGNRLVWQRP